MGLTVKTDYDTEADAAYIDLDSSGHVLGIELIGVMSMIGRPRIE